MCLQDGKSATNYVNNIKKGLDILKEEVRRPQPRVFSDSIASVPICVCAAAKDLCEPSANPRCDPPRAAQDRAVL